jgi:uncharacterized protein
LEALDILRGMALFGVMAINLEMGFRISVFQRYEQLNLPGSVLDDTIVALLALLFSAKALAIFTLLFGIGLAIQVERLSRTGRAMELLLRRLAILLLIGLFHMLVIWPGDILTEYAVAGFIALPFLFKSARVVAGAALGFAALYCLCLIWLPYPHPDMEWTRGHVAEAFQAHRSGAFSDVLLLHLRELPTIARWHLYALPLTVASFLFGAWIWRSGIVQDVAAHERRLKGVGWAGCTGGLVLVFVGAVGFHGSPAAERIADQASTMALALGYSAIVLLVASKPFGQKLLGWAAPLGRMAFTNYLAQSVIFALVFFGYGLAMFNRMGTATAFGFGVALYALQAVASAYWLRHHRFGPVEWLWRTAMYGTRQPWRVPFAASIHSLIPPQSAPPPADRS